LRSGARLGAWQLETLLGEGGMGQVWRAHRADGLYEAVAAIKLLRAELGSEELRQRFARERRLLGRLRHPGVAQLLDAGVDARYGAYLVLEFVAGQTLAPHVRERQLPVAARVRLLVDVAQAVQAAHAQLVVHRDLKPANVIVGPDGATKLLDFGIATLLDPDTTQPHSELTAWAGARLTPAYAAPEQVAGEAVGTGADQYALGVMLFELLTGFLPQGAGQLTRAQLEHAVLHREPARFAELLRLPERREGCGRPPDAPAALGDLEAVCAKALRKEAGERYASVGAFVEDLQRYLASQPVSVRREDWQHRTRLWLRRNRALALSTTLVLAALSGGLALALHQRTLAQQAARDAEAVSHYMTELLESASPDRHGGRPPSVIELLESRRAELPQRFTDQPAVKDRVLATLVATYLGMNRFDIAIPLAQQRLDAARREWGEEAEPTEEALVGLARLHTALANRSPAAALLEPLLPRLRARHGPDHERTVTARQQLAMAYAGLGRFAESEALLAEEWASVQRSYDAPHYNRAFHAQYLFVLRTEQGRLVEAERLIAALAEQQALASPQQQRFVRVSERNHAQAQWRLLMQNATQAVARAEDLGARIDALLGPGNDLHGTLRSALAEHLWQLDEADAALEHLLRWQREQQPGAAEQRPTRSPGWCANSPCWRRGRVPARRCRPRRSRTACAGSTPSPCWPVSAAPTACCTWPMPRCWACRPPPGKRCWSGCWRPCRHPAWSPCRKTRRASSACARCTRCAPGVPKHGCRPRAAPASCWPACPSRRAWRATPPICSWRPRCAPAAHRPPSSRPRWRAPTPPGRRAWTPPWPAAATRWTACAASSPRASRIPPGPGPIDPAAGPARLQSGLGVPPALGDSL
jgi:serine/threonine protein kinase